jgi:hypothetical protein
MSTSVTIVQGHHAAGLELQCGGRATLTANQTDVAMKQALRTAVFAAQSAPRPTMAYGGCTLAQVCVIPAVKLYYSNAG